MSIITLYHGTPNEFVTPQYGYGEDIFKNMMFSLGLLS